MTGVAPPPAAPPRVARALEQIVTQDALDGCCGSDRASGIEREDARLGRGDVHQRLLGRVERRPRKDGVNERAERRAAWTLALAGIP